MIFFEIFTDFKKSPAFIKCPKKHSYLLFEIFYKFGSFRVRNVLSKLFETS